MKVSNQTLIEDSFITEMANFLADITDLPANIVLWAKTQPDELPHVKYRMKVYKNRIHVATYSIGADPILRWKIGLRKARLDGYETSEARKVISEFASLFIQLIDGKLSTDQVKQEIKKSHGSSAPEE
jgi:hypothetical protein